MKRICGIYKITSPKNKIYIGKSVHINDRLRKYAQAKCFSQTLIYRSIKKYGWAAHKFEIIHQCERDELGQLEKYYIELYNTFNSKFGLNLMSGDGKNYKHSDETKRKIGDAHKGMKFSLEAKQKMSIAASRTKNFTGKRHSEETKQKMRLAKLGKPGNNTGNKFSNEAKLKISLALTGKKQSEQTIRKRIETKKRIKLSLQNNNSKNAIAQPGQLF